MRKREKEKKKKKKKGKIKEFGSTEWKSNRGNGEEEIVGIHWNVKMNNINGPNAKEPHQAMISMYYYRKNLRINATCFFLSIHEWFPSTCFWSTEIHSL